VSLLTGSDGRGLARGGRELRLGQSDRRFCAAAAFTDYSANIPQNARKVEAEQPR